MPSPLVLYACTALRHALDEWRRNDRCCPAMPKNGRDICVMGNTSSPPGMMAVGLPCVCPSRHWLTSCSEVYWQLCATWNSLPGAYQKLVMRSVQSALEELLRGGPYTAPGVPATMVLIPYDAGAMATCLAADVNEDVESPFPEEDPETAEAMANPAAAAEAEEDAEGAAAAEAAEADGDVGSHSGRAFSKSLAHGHLDQPMPSAPPPV
jgi:hypothetical protein